MQQALDRACEAMLEQGLVGFSDAVAAEIDDLAARFDDPRATLSDDEAARVALALDDKLLRDAMLVRLSESDDALRRLREGVELEDGPTVEAFVGDAQLNARGIDVSEHGGWAAFVSSRARPRARGPTSP